MGQNVIIATRGTTQPNVVTRNHNNKHSITFALWIEHLKRAPVVVPKLISEDLHP